MVGVQIRHIFLLIGWDRSGLSAGPFVRVADIAVDAALQRHDIRHHARKGDFARGQHVEVDLHLVNRVDE